MMQPLNVKLQVGKRVPLLAYFYTSLAIPSRTCSSHRLLHQRQRKRPLLLPPSPDKQTFQSESTKKGSAGQALSFTSSRE
jgi:hypothetical protein